MASSPLSNLISSLFLLAIPLLQTQGRCYESIISFGDSIADTGNALYLSLLTGHLPHFASLPYGETFFHHPTGRYSDGRIIIDFIAEYLGLPFVQPYFGNGTTGRFEKGINFAVGGATALDRSFLEEKGIHYQYTNVSLGVQLRLFKEFLPNFCGSSSDCSHILGNSLILLGEIGGNDYNYPFFMNKSIVEIRELVPLVVGVISSSLKELIELGGRTFLVPGNFPIGCAPVYLTVFQTSNKEEYDPITGCLNWLNKFSEYHNELLQTELNQIMKLHPHVTIFYADYYNPMLRIYRNPTKYGFMRNQSRGCCGGGGPFGFNFWIMCGNPGASCCDDPSIYVNWDGIHLTEAAYRLVAMDILEEQYSIPRINASCISFKYNVDASNRELI